MKKKVLYLVLFLSICLLNACNKQGSSGGNASNYLKRFQQVYVCPRTGFTIADSKKNNLECPIGKEALELVQLMVDSGWSVRRISRKVRLFRQGRRIVRDILTQRNCSEKGILKMEIFVMPYCYYGVKFINRILPDMESRIGKILNWTPYHILRKNRQGNISSRFGLKDLNESLRMICIREIFGKKKYLKYFKCFARHLYRKKGKDWKFCARRVGISENRLYNCWKNDAMKLAEKDLKLSRKYRAGGSPTTIYNCNKKIVGALSFNRSKPAICTFFKGTKPDFCQ